MEDPSGSPEMETEEEPLLGRPTKGGIRTLPFIVANEALESLASNGLSPNMTRYLMGDYGFSAAQASNVIFFWNSANGATPIIAAFLADSYLGRYRTIASGTVFSFLGISLLWLTAVIPEARPSSSNSATALQLLLLFSSFGIMSIGAGGIRGSSLAFGGNQLNSKKNKGVLETFIGWYYVGTLVGMMTAMTLIVYIQDKFGWKLGFGIPVVLMLLSMVSFLVASPFYVKMKPNSNLLSRLLQVIVASYRKRNLEFSSDGVSELFLYHHDSDEANLVKPTQKFRILNKACIIRTPGEEDTSDPWSLCTVSQVEDLKKILKVIPIWAAGIIFSVSFSQNTLPYLQISSMNRHITPNFELPTGSFTIFLFITIGLYVLLYDRLLVPLLTKLRHKQTRLKPTHKIAFGLLLSSFSLASMAVVELNRRSMAVQSGRRMSAFWMLPHYVLSGIADASCMIGQNEFFYSELPKSMSSIAIALPGLSMAVGNLVASLIMAVVDKATSWVSSDVNEGRYDYYYWLISGLCFCNFLYFVVCSRRYGEEGEEDGARNAEE